MKNYKTQDFNVPGTSQHFGLVPNNHHFSLVPMERVSVLSYRVATMPHRTLQARELAMLKAFSNVQRACTDFSFRVFR